MQPSKKFAFDVSRIFDIHPTAGAITGLPNDIANITAPVSLHSFLVYVERRTYDKDTQILSMFAQF